MMDCCCGSTEEKTVDVIEHADADPDPRTSGATVASLPTDRSTRSLRLSVSDKTLLRGCTLPRLLGRFGRHLVSARVHEAEKARILSESRVVRRLDAFVSHSWRDSGMAKYVCLLLYCNGAQAAAASIGASAVACALGSAGVLPLWKEHYSYAPWPTVVGCPAFLLSIIYLHHAPHWLGGGRSSSYFLDKLCIDQSDPARKKAGIESIGAFVAASDRMVIMWSQTYFTRLWCTVEVAMFLHTRWRRRLSGLSGKGDLRRSLVFKPLQLSALTGFMMVFLQVQVAMPIPWYYVGASIGVEFVGSAVLPAISYFVACLGFLHYARSYVRDSENLGAQLSQFKIEEAGCSDESDRDIIYATIRECYGSLDTFNGLVRGQFREAVLAGLPSKSGMPFSVVVFSLMPLLHNALDWTAHNVQFYRDDWRSMASHTLYVFSVLPTSWLLMDLICRLVNTQRVKRMWHPYPLRNVLVSLALNVPVMMVFYAVFGLSNVVRWLHPAFGTAQIFVTCSLIIMNETCFERSPRASSAADFQLD